MTEGGLRLCAGDRRDLPSARRPLAAFLRRGCELHAHRRKAGRRPSSNHGLRPSRPGRASRISQFMDVVRVSDSSWLWGRIHHHRRGRADRAQRRASVSSPACSAPWGATHVRFLVRLSVRDLDPVRRARERLRTAAGRPLAFWAVGCWVGALMQIAATAPDARGDDRALLRGGDRLHQDRADPGRIVRPRVPRRPRSRRAWRQRSWIATAGVIVMSAKSGRGENRVRRATAGGAPAARASRPAPALRSPRSAIAARS